MGSRAASTAPTVMLRPARWIRLPGTDVEVLLHGKHRQAGQDGMIVRQDGPPDRYGGWDLHPVMGQCWIRRVQQAAGRL